MSQPFRPSFPHPLPVFECRSQVGALKVRAKVPTGSGYDLHFEDDRFPVLSVGRDFEWPYLILREIDQAGGYVVRFEPDGDVFFVRGELFDALGFKAAQEATNADRWIEWNGGLRPVDYNTHVDVRTKGAGGDNIVAGSLRWSHADHPEDIIAYRVVKGGAA